MPPPFRGFGCKFYVSPRLDQCILAARLTRIQSGIYRIHSTRERKICLDSNPHGTQNHPSAFSRLIEFVFRGFRNSVIYLNDVLVGSKTWEDHIQHLEDSFCQLQRYNLKLNLKKCIFAAPEIEYLGYTISAGSIKPGKEKTQAVKEFPAPKTVKKKSDNSQDSPITLEPSSRDMQS